MATVFRDIVVNRPFVLPRAPQGSQEPPNLLFTTLATLALGSPIVDYDYPNPRAADRLQVVDYPVNLLMSTLGSVALGNPVHTYDWANPQQIRRVPLLDPYQNLLSTTLIPISTLPFSVNYWPLPIVATRSAVTNLTHIFYYIQDSVGPPSYNYDFPNPLGPKFSISAHNGYTFGVELANLPGPPQNLFYGYADPVPAGPRRGISLYGFVQAIPVTLIPLPVPPFLGITFDNPTLRVNFNHRYETVSLLASGQLQPIPAPTYFGSSGMLVRGV